MRAAGALLVWAVLLPALAGAGEAAPPELPPLPEKIAQVGQYVITGEEFQRDLTIRARQLAARTGRPVIRDGAFRRETLGARIDAVVLQQIAEASVSIEDAAVEKEFARARAGFPSEERFQEWMTRTGVNADTLRREIRARLAIRAYSDQKTANLSVTEDEVRAHYDALSAEGLMRRSVRTADVSHLVVTVKGDTPEDSQHAKERAEAARSRILAGEAFEEVAREMSEDPAVSEHGGRFLEASGAGFPPLIAEKIFLQPAGELPEPFEGGGAWHLLRVDGVNEPGVVPYEKASERLRAAVLARKKQEVLETLVDSARKVTHIEVFSGDMAPDVRPPLPEKKEAP
ncbi:MAG: hypothetical protein GXY15_07740 [Candidatus Hydrogenedentes bacterium]|nr:hypothetical protein [Candidatus Hydrogenedentota bacterium]